MHTRKGFFFSLRGGGRVRVRVRRGRRQAWKQQNHMSKTIYEQMGVFQHEVSFFDPKMVTLKGKKGHHIFRHTETRKKTCFATMAVDSFWERQASTG